MLKCEARPYPLDHPRNAEHAAFTFSRPPLGSWNEHVGNRHRDRSRWQRAAAFAPAGVAQTGPSACSDDCGIGGGKAKAAELSRLSQFRFGQALVERGIARLYSDEDIAEDLTYAGGQ